MSLSSTADRSVSRGDPSADPGRAAPLVSVLILTYNHAPYIDECLRSVYSQITDFDFEVVIGDDCSTDGAQEKLKEWRDRHPGRTTLLLRERNLGGGGCMNLEATLKECRGEFIALLEGDDYWTHDGKLQAQAKVMAASVDVTACTHATRIDSPDCTDVVLFRHPQPSGDVSLEYLLKSGPSHTSSYMVRKSVLDGRPASYRTLPMGDWPLLVHCASVGRVVSLGEAVWSVYRVQGQGTWAARGLVHRTQGEIRALQAFAAVLPEGLRRCVHNQLLLRQVWLAEGYWAVGDRGKAIREALPAIAGWPFRTPVNWRSMVRLVARLVLPSWLLPARLDSPQRHLKNAPKP